MSASDALMHDRYGRRTGPWPRWAWGPVALVAAAVLVWAYQVSVRISVQEVEGTLAGVTVRSATLTDVNFDVTFRSAGSALCRVRVTNERGTVVGWSDVEVTTARAGSVRVVEPVRTSEIGQEGGVQGCITT